MKFKTMVLVGVTGAVILAMGYEYLQAQPNIAGLGSKIGIIRVGDALRNCQATLKFREKAIADKQTMDAEENQLRLEAEALAESLKAYKPNSNDYNERLQEMLQKQSKLKALQEVNPHRRRLMEMQWTQNLYQEILRITKELADQKSLNLVLAAEEPQFPYQRYEELVMTLSTHKVLYNKGCVDLTNEVIAQLNKIQSKFQYQ